MGKKQYDISKVNSNSLNAKWVKNEGSKLVVSPVSFFQLFKYSTKLDKFLNFLGVFGALATGILQPLQTVLYGGLAGDVIEYAQSIATNETLSPEQRNTIEEKFFDGIRHFSLMVSLIGIGMLIFSYISSVTFSYTSMRQVFKIRSDYLKAILNQDISWYDQNETGDVASRMSEDLYKLEDGIGEKVPMFLHFPILFITAVGIALYKGWELALVSLIYLPASMLAFGISNFLTTKLAKNEMEAYGASGSIAEEVLSLIRTVTAFGGQQKEIERYKKNLVTARKNNIRRSLLNGIGFGLLFLFTYSSYGLAFWYGVRLLLKERGDPNATYTPGNMVTVFFSVMTASLNFSSTFPFLEVFAVSKASAAKIFSVIEHKPIINLSKGKGEVIESFKGHIKFKNVKFHYPSRADVPVLQELNLEIKPGDTVALVGSSGNGKSTVIQLIQRLYDAVSGEVLVDDVNIKDLDLTWYRNRIGIVGQEPVLFGTTIHENIKYGKDGVTDEEIIAAAKKANAHNFIKTLPNGYNTLVGERGTQLSGGQKQRIAIARALVRKPTLMLLDEATSALDNASEAKVQAALDLASVDCTTIIVAHRLSTIRGANKIFVLSQGAVVEEGSHEKLMELKKEYYKLVTAQMRDTDDEEGIKKISLRTDDNEEVDVEKDQSDDEINETDDFKSDKKVSMFEIIKMNGPEWPFLLVAISCSIVIGFAIPVFAVLFGSILGQLANSDNEYVRTQTNFYCMCFVAAGIICMITVFFEHYFFGTAGEKMTERIRTQLFTAMVSQEIGFFDKKANGVGALCAKLSGDAASIQGATGQRVGTILQSISIFTLVVGLSLYFQWKLGLLTAIFMPVMIIGIIINRNSSSGQNGMRDKALQKSTKIAVEAVGNIRTVAGLVLEDKFVEIYIAELKPYYKSSIKAIHGRAFLYGLAKSLAFFNYATTVYFGGFLIIDGMPYDSMFKVAQAQIISVTSIANALTFATNLGRGISSAKKVKIFLSKLPLIRDFPNSNILSEVNGDINFLNIEFAYPTRPNIQILNGLNLDVFNGKTVALVGESGCGKSTIIQMIERFYDPNSGQVILDGQNIKNVSLASLRSQLGIVSQEPNLFNKTIAENIAYGDNSRNVSMDEIIQAAKNANIHNFIAALPKGYDTTLGDKAVQLSGGQKQRIAIARALVRNPKILLLDEATSALDTESERVVQEALDQAKKGRTCITIAHRLTTIQDADLICVIDKGVVVESGTHKELIEKRELYYKLYTQKR